MPALAGAPFLSFIYIFLYLTAPSITQWWLQWRQQWPTPAPAYCCQCVTIGKYTFYYYLWFFSLIWSNDDSGLLQGTAFPWWWLSSPSNFQGDDDSPSLAQRWCWELVKQYLANHKKHVRILKQLIMSSHSTMASTDNPHVDASDSYLPVCLWLRILYSTFNVHLHGPGPTFHILISVVLMSPCTYFIPAIECFCLSGLSLDQLEFWSG